MSVLQKLRVTLKNSETFYILDTETTGLHDGEICQIAIIDNHGKIHFDTLIQTKMPIPEEATAIHGITDNMVKNSPDWTLLCDPIQDLLKGQNVVIYNATYDRKMLHKTAERHGLIKYEWKEQSTFLCTMLAFAELYGDWNAYYGSYRWKPLSLAASYCDVVHNDAHSALGDCFATLGVVNYMLNFPEKRD